MLVLDITSSYKVLTFDVVITLASQIGCRTSRLYSAERWSPCLGTVITVQVAASAVLAVVAKRVLR